jgi:hypothetical protein
MLRESFSELQTEAQIAPLDLKFPPEDRYAQSGVSARTEFEDDYHGHNHSE